MVFFLFQAFQEEEKMGTTQDTNLTNAIVYNFLIRNSFHEIASEFKETLRNQIDDIKIQDVNENDFKLENLVGDLFVRSLVYEFLRRKSHARVAFQYQLEFGPFFRDLKGLTLEKIFAIYKQKTGFVIPNDVCHQNPTIDNTSNSMMPIDLENSPTNSSSSKKVPFLVYDYLMRNEHISVANELKELTGPFDNISDTGAKIEDMYSEYMNTFRKNENIQNSDHIEDVVVDEGDYLGIVSLNTEFKDQIKHFKPVIGSQMDQVVLYLITKKTKTYNFSLNLTWGTIQHKPKEYPWMSIRHFSICVGGEIEIMMKNFQELISNARVNNPEKFCKEISQNSQTKMRQSIPENAKWKLIIIGAYLSKGLVKKRHPFDVLFRVVDEIKSKKVVKGSFTPEEDEIISKEVENYGGGIVSKELWINLCTKLNRTAPRSIKQRYGLLVKGNRIKGQHWSLEEDIQLVKSLLRHKSQKNVEYISNISKSHLREAKVDQEINRHLDNINNHWRSSIMPLLLQYHLGTINTPWKYSLLEYLYENRVMNFQEIDMKEIKNKFPWLNRYSASACFRGLSEYNSKVPLHEVAKVAMAKFKDKPALSEKQLERCETLIQSYDPQGDLGKFRL